MSDAPTVFIVDDDASFRKAVARLLCVTGYPVKAFFSGEEFMAALTPDAPGCALVDLQMPGLNGLELQEALVQVVQGKMNKEIANALNIHDRIAITTKLDLYFVAELMKLWMETR